MPMRGKFDNSYNIFFVHELSRLRRYLKKSLVDFYEVEKALGKIKRVVV